MLKLKIFKYSIISHLALKLKECSIIKKVWLNYNNIFIYTKGLNSKNIEFSTLYLQNLLH